MPESILCLHTTELSKEKIELENEIQLLQGEAESKSVLILTLQSQLEVTQFCIMFSCVCIKCCFAQEVYCILILITRLNPLTHKLFLK